MDLITRDMHSDFTKIPFFRPYRKKVLTFAIRMPGPFEVQTREGRLKCPDGYLAFDQHGWPYPIAWDEFDKIYEPAWGHKQWPIG